MNPIDIEYYNLFMNFATDLCKRRKNVSTEVIDKVVSIYRPIITAYPKRLIKTLPCINNKDTILFTITTCKRFDLFEQTMNTILNCFDIEEIDDFFIVDDNSSEEDREKMKTLYPFCNFYFKTQEEKGHPRSMNIIKNYVKTEYLIHLEDDWKFFVKKDYVKKAKDVLDKCLSMMPDENIPYDGTIFTICATYYQLHEIEKGNELAKKLFDIFEGDLRVYNSQKGNHRAAYRREVDQAKEILKRLTGLTQQFKQEKLGKEFMARLAAIIPAEELNAEPQMP
jgi:hypothetical protein